VKEDLRMSKVLTREAFENAIKLNAAIGGSTNFVIHLLAIAGRIGVDLTLEDFDRLSADVPLLLNLQPSGKYFMEDFYYAGGLPVVVKNMLSKLHQDAITVTGKTVKENVQKAECFDDDVIATLEAPVKDLTGLVVLTGNLCKDGAVMKPSASLKPSLLKHRGPAVVFEDIDHYKLRLDDPALEVDENSVMVLKNVGPKGYPGMPEVGNMGIPKRLLEKGVTDMVRISDGRMSGTGFGTVILHVSPEAAVGGVRSLNLEVSDEELVTRKQNWKPLDLGYDRGYVNLYVNHVTQAHQGADMDFLIGGSGDKVTRDSH
jgi:L-arabonate dehydrase